MSEFCPISEFKINEKAARLNALLVIICVLTFILTSYKWIILFLILDFALRATNTGKYSLISKISKTVINISKLTPVMVDAKPKFFAAGIGFIFCVIISVLQFLGLQAYANITAFILVFFASLEGLFGYCVGCKAYAVLHKLRVISWS